MEKAIVREGDFVEFEHTHDEQGYLPTVGFGKVILVKNSIVHIIFKSPRGVRTVTNRPQDEVQVVIRI